MRVKNVKSRKYFPYMLAGVLAFTSAGANDSTKTASPPNHPAPITARVPSSFLAGLRLLAEKYKAGPIVGKSKRYFRADDAPVLRRASVSPEANTEVLFSLITELTFIASQTYPNIDVEDLRGAIAYMLSEEPYLLVLLAGGRIRESLVAEAFRDKREEMMKFLEEENILRAMETDEPLGLKQDSLIDYAEKLSFMTPSLTLPVLLTVKGERYTKGLSNATKEEIYKYGELMVKVGNYLIEEYMRTIMPRHLPDNYKTRYAPYYEIKLHNSDDGTRDMLRRLTKLVWVGSTLKLLATQRKPVEERPPISSFPISVTTYINKDEVALVSLGEELSREASVLFQDISTYSNFYPFDWKAYPYIYYGGYDVIGPTPQYFALDSGTVVPSFLPGLFGSFSELVNVSFYFDSELMRYAAEARIACDNIYEYLKLDAAYENEVKKLRNDVSYKVSLNEAEAIARRYHLTDLSLAREFAISKLMEPKLMEIRKDFFDRLMKLFKGGDYLEGLEIPRGVLPPCRFVEGKRRSIINLPSNFNATFVKTETGYGLFFSIVADILLNAGRAGEETASHYFGYLKRVLPEEFFAHLSKTLPTGVSITAKYSQLIDKINFYSPALSGKIEGLDLSRYDGKSGSLGWSILIDNLILRFEKIRRGEERIYDSFIDGFGANFVYRNIRVPSKSEWDAPFWSGTYAARAALFLKEMQEDCAAFSNYGDPLLLARIDRICELVSLLQKFVGEEESGRFYLTVRRANESLEEMLWGYSGFRRFSKEYYDLFFGGGDKYYLVFRHVEDRSSPDEKGPALQGVFVASKRLMVGQEPVEIVALSGTEKLMLSWARGGNLYKADLSQALKLLPATPQGTPSLAVSVKDGKVLALIYWNFGGSKRGFLVEIDNSYLRVVEAISIGVSGNEKGIKVSYQRPVLPSVPSQDSQDSPTHLPTGEGR